jgi:hypothetical protein
MADRKLFDLHFEIGITAYGKLYAKTQLGGPAGVSFRKEAALIPDAIFRTAVEMAQSGVWPILKNNPHYATYPFDSSMLKANLGNNKLDPNAPKLKPSELTSVPHPQCQLQCSSYDIFGASRCKNMCGHRTGL